MFVVCHGTDPFFLFVMVYFCTFKPYLFHNAVVEMVKLGFSIKLKQLLFTSNVCSHSFQASGVLSLVKMSRKGLMEQDLSKLDVTKLHPLSPEVISRQATINIGKICP